jgi:hypothetical protein
MPQPQIQPKSRAFGISFLQEIKVNIMTLLKSLIAFLLLSPVIAHSQIILPHNSVGFVDFAKFVVTVDKATAAPDDKILTFVGDCGNCPRQLEINSNTNIYFKGKNAVDVSKLKTNTTYKLRSLSYNIEHKVALGIAIATNY